MPRAAKSTAAPEVRKTSCPTPCPRPQPPPLLKSLLLKGFVMSLWNHPSAPSHPLHPVGCAPALSPSCAGRMHITLLALTRSPLLLLEIFCVSQEIQGTRVIQVDSAGSAEANGIYVDQGNTANGRRMCAPVSRTCPPLATPIVA